MSLIYNTRFGFSLMDLLDNHFISIDQLSLFMFTDMTVTVGVTPLSYVVISGIIFTVPLSVFDVSSLLFFLLLFVKFCASAIVLSFILIVSLVPFCLT